MRATLACAAFLIGAQAVAALANPPPAPPGGGTPAPSRTTSTQNVPDPDITPEMLASKLRGIRAVGRAPGTKSQTGQAAEAPAPSVDLNVPFATGSAQLEAPAQRIVTALGTALTAPSLRGNHFVIEGHTDTVGSAKLNQKLSEARARSVAAYLIAHFNIAPKGLDIKGVGASDLAVQTPDQTAEPRNRRVKVINLGVL